MGLGLFRRRKWPGREEWDGPFEARDPFRQGVDFGSEGSNFGGEVGADGLYLGAEAPLAREDQGGEGGPDPKRCDSDAEDGDDFWTQGLRILPAGPTLPLWPGPGRTRPRRRAVAVRGGSVLRWGARGGGVGEPAAAGEAAEGREAGVEGLWG